MATVAIIDLHGQPHAHTQVILELVRGTGFEGEIHDPRRGRLPARPAAVLITGGPGSPEARGPWRARLQAAAREWAKAVPVLALGLGFEVLAQAQGWAVRRLERPRSGWHPVTPTAVGAADPLVSQVSPGALVFEDRTWGVLPPPAAVSSRNVVLAYSSAGDVAAARFGARTVGMIFHPEARGGPEGALTPRVLTDFVRQAFA